MKNRWPFIHFCAQACNEKIFFNVAGGYGDVNADTEDTKIEAAMNIK